MAQFLSQSEAALHSKWGQLEAEETGRFESPSFEWFRLPKHLMAERNRYGKAEPFATQRIKLNVCGEGSDYINASPIRLGSRTYIAAQGPRPNTINHFYRMLAEQALLPGPIVIVMLTRTHEEPLSPSEKCAEYFPITEKDSPWAIPADESFGDKFQGSIILQDLVKYSSIQSEIRHLFFRFSRDGVTFQEREIIHLLFQTWPDHAAPDKKTEEALVRLVTFASALNQACTDMNSPLPEQNGISRSATPGISHESSAPSNPLIVHCSAGCGRTGTFISLDYLLLLLEAGELNDVPLGQDPVFDTVDRLRRQRVMMVQKESQFHFIYNMLQQQMRARKEQSGQGDLKQASCVLTSYISVTEVA